MLLRSSLESQFNYIANLFMKKRCKNTKKSFRGLKALPDGIALQDKVTRFDGRVLIVSLHFFPILPLRFASFYAISHLCMSVRKGLLLPELKKNYGDFYPGHFLPLKFYTNMYVLFNCQKCDCPFQSHL